jgi:hypothetical protein
VSAKQVRILFAAGCLATTLALTWAGITPRESGKYARADICSIDDGQVTGSGTAAAWTPKNAVPMPLAGICPLDQTDASPLVKAPVEVPATPDVEPPATVQNLRRADSR